jgi:hypothetical protein
LIRFYPHVFFIYTEHFQKGFKKANVPPVPESAINYDDVYVLKVDSKKMALKRMSAILKIIYLV